mgnify:CR=1 FL=1
MTRYDSLVISLNRSVEPSLDRQTLNRLASISACQSILLAGAIGVVVIVTIFAIFLSLVDVSLGWLMQAVIG